MRFNLQKKRTEASSLKHLRFVEFDCVSVLVKAANMHENVAMMRRNGCPLYFLVQYIIFWYDRKNQLSS
jgi:hypothetical protein